MEKDSDAKGIGRIGFVRLFGADPKTIELGLTMIVLVV